jgi:HTH-type transcriptional regulator/antitoxin HigA
MARETTRSVAEVYAPGEFIREELEARGWTQGDLCKILRRPLQSINEIINGKKEITPETALALGEAFGTSAELWLNLENTYRLSKARAKQADTEIGRRARIYSLAPIKELQERGWIKAASNLDELEAEVCRFLEISSVTEQPKLALVARRGDGYGELSSTQIAWAFRAKHVASEIKVCRFNPQRFEALLPTLTRLSVREDGGGREAIAQLAKAGVRVVVVPRLPNTHIDGAMFWLRADAPVVAISLRYDRIDSFWFTLMHELAHVCQGSAKEGVLDIDLISEIQQDPKARPEYEKKADMLASKWLVPCDMLCTFIRSTKPYYSRDSIVRFASQAGVHPGIVVGRLHHLREMKYSNLRDMLKKVSSSLPVS